MSSVLKGVLLPPTFRLEGSLLWLCHAPENVAFELSLVSWMFKSEGSPFGGEGGEGFMPFHILPGCCFLPLKSFLITMIHQSLLPVSTFSWHKVFLSCGESWLTCIHVNKNHNDDLVLTSIPGPFTYIYEDFT